MASYFCGSREIALADMDAWESFASNNKDTLEAKYGSTAAAYQHAVQGGLTLGGADALVHIYFED